jgi:hypothetical protein
MNSALSFGLIFCVEPFFRMVLKCLRKTSRKFIFTEKHLKEASQTILNIKPKKIVAAFGTKE